MSAAGDHAGGAGAAAGGGGDRKSADAKTRSRASTEGAAATRMQRTLANPPSIVEGGGFTFVITDGPQEKNVHLYVETFRALKVSVIARACEDNEATYDPKHFEEHGIRVVSLGFADGELPPHALIEDWLDLLAATKKETSSPVIAVHCVAGLGRAPVLVVIALIESGMEPIDAIEFVRERRRGAINAKQLKELQVYRRRRGAKCAKCSVM